jgi:hypothetical protein
MPIAWAGWSAGGTQPPANCDLWVTTFKDGALENRILGKSSRWTLNPLHS